MEKAYKLEFAASQGGSLYNTSCGCSKTEPLHCFGPAVKPFYLIHYILSGKGKFIHKEKEYHLEEGYGFLITPEELAFYQSDERDPWTYVWVGFTGDQAESVVEGLGLSASHPVFYSDRKQEIYDTVTKMMEYNTYSFSDNLRRNGYLSVFLSLLATGSDAQINGEEDRANNHVEKAIEFVRMNYCNPIKVTDIAEYVCINRSYLYSLFEEYLHISPQQFLTMYRVTKSLELLHSTDYPIESIAISCGYTDAIVYTKAFRKKMGMSPSAYRNEMRSGGAQSSKVLLHGLEDFISKGIERK